MIEATSAPAPKATIVVDDVHVKYRVFASGKRMGSAPKAIITPRTRATREVHALRGVSLTVHEGETLGVIGRNGSGKSTLLGAISGLLPTTSGRIWAEDRPILLGVNAALLPDLSGERNIVLGLLALGSSRAEATARVAEIAEFAELEEFIHHPMQTYSSGMAARLRFAIGASKDHSILLIDEALAVGDRAFKLKSEERVRQMQRNAGTVLLVSHSMGSIRDMCSRVIWVDRGVIRMEGPPDDVIDAYHREAGGA